MSMPRVELQLTKGESSMTDSTSTPKVHESHKISNTLRSGFQNYSHHLDEPCSFDFRDLENGDPSSEKFLLHQGRANQYHLFGSEPLKNHHFQNHPSKLQR